jgi:hypothetical protein
MKSEQEVRRFYEQCRSTVRIEQCPENMKKVYQEHIRILAWVLDLEGREEEEPPAGLEPAVA